VSIEVAGPNSWVNFLKSFGSSYAAQWRKASWSSRVGEAAPELAAPAALLLELHAESKMLPPATATTTEPLMNARRLIRCALSGDARIFRPSSGSLIPLPPSAALVRFSSGDRGRFVARRIGEHDLGLLRPEHVRVTCLPRAPHLTADLQSRRPGAWEPGDDLLAP